MPTPAYFDVDAPIRVGGVQSDTLSENTAAAGVTIDGLLVKDGSVRPATIADPGASGAIAVTTSGTCALTSAGAETRTLAIPAFIGQRLALVHAVDGGAIVVTSAQALNQTGNNTITLTEVNDFIELVAVAITGGALRWRVAANDGAVLSTV